MIRPNAPWRQATPFRMSVGDHVRNVVEILASMAVLALWFVAIIFAFPVLFAVLS